MRLLLFIPLLLLLSCKKDKVPLPCTGVSMIGDRELFVGKWRWYNTIVEEWFDIGPSNWYDYTPQNQGFEYHAVISSDGVFKGYKNGELIDDFALNEIIYETTTGEPLWGLTSRINCSTEYIDLIMQNPNGSKDSIYILTYPLNFDDQENHLRSHTNYFVKM